MFNKILYKRKNLQLVHGSKTLFLLLCFALSACAEKELEPLTDAVFTASNVHLNNEVISETAEIDALLSSSQDNILDRQTTIFEINSNIMEKKDRFSKSAVSYTHLTLPTKA